jgi:ubiquinone/menaquinone biosynthesis C-methylase UbiE
MIPRILEPEAMDTAEDAQDYDAMDHSTVNLRFVADFLQFRGAGQSGQILDVGTGTARIPLALSDSDPQALILGIDLAESMLALGRKNIEAANKQAQITLERQDAKRLTYPSAHFTAVISNSIIHHIPEPASAFAEMVRVLAQGGTMYVRDLVRPDSTAQLEELVQLYAGNEAPHARQLFADSLNAALTLDEVRTMVAALGASPESVSLTSDRHWTWAWQRP